MEDLTKSDNFDSADADKSNSGSHRRDREKEAGFSHPPSAEDVPVGQSIESRGRQLDSTEMLESFNEIDDALPQSIATLTQADARRRASCGPPGDHVPVRQERFEWIHRFELSREATFHLKDSEINLRVVPSASQRQQFAGPIFVDIGAHLVFCDGYFLVSSIVDCQPSGTAFERPLLLDFCVEDVSEGEFDGFEISDELKEELDAFKESLLEEFKVLWQEESHLPWRRLNESDMDIVFDDGKFFLRAKIYHFTRFALGKGVNMESPYHIEKIVSWGFGRQRREIHCWNATGREIMFIIFPLSFINKATQAIDTGASLPEGPSIHLAVSRAIDQGLLESGTDPQIKDLPPKREEAGGVCPHAVFSLSRYTANEAMVSLMTCDAKQLSVWDYQCIQGNTRVVVLPRRFECIRPKLGVHRCDDDSDLRRVALLAVVKRLPRSAPVSRISR